MQNISATINAQRYLVNWHGEMLGKKRRKGVLLSYLHPWVGVKHTHSPFVLPEHKAFGFDNPVLVSSAALFSAIAVLALAPKALCLLEAKCC